ncbi:substrate-binding domain-containing protein [Allobranchiibius sp. GilTou38]|uniref:substrate-binding domain-containing protein n=1 Tax=Allobranchiibius sp. GilTou38 TaxID=2815210 RepID=UPI001AA11A3C|nr:substrate-binding domain-containing protein [Allobranchiibius sp. GilTou38]MBO1765981.1 extracellular solute-binding protein [Allobranchiibius sp. GilTou38]
MKRLLGSLVLVTLGTCATAGCGGGSSSPGSSSAGASGSGSSSSSASTTTSSTSPAKGSGSVNVLYAGSLVKLMEDKIGPGFKAATGYSFSGFSAGSTALASQIKGKVRRGDVFVSASPKADQSLMGTANGDWVSWYVTFGSSKLVLGINPKSRFASALKTEPWYDVITQPGFKVGFTDPKTDPKGKLTAQALSDDAKAHPALSKVASSTSDVFPEETLVANLQSGQLDAGFFYTSEAKTAGIQTVPLTGTDLKASYTVTVLKGAPNAAGAAAFVKYLLGSQTQAIFKAAAFTVTSPPKVTGTPPAGLLPSS